MYGLKSFSASAWSAAVLSLALLTAGGCGKHIQIVKSDEAAEPAHQTAPTPVENLPSETIQPQKEPVVVVETPAVTETDIADKGTGAAASANLQDVFFDFDQSAITDQAKTLLKGNADWLLAHRDVRLRIEGTTDERGTDQYNLALGERRAQAVKQYLVSLGVEAGRMETISYGEEKQYCKESNESCWSQNRRAHFTGPASVGK